MTLPWPYQVDLATGEGWAELHRVEAWCSERGLPFKIYDPLRSEHGARICFKARVTADACIVAFGGYLVSEVELLATKKHDDEMDELFEQELADVGGEFLPPQHRRR